MGLPATSSWISGAVGGGLFLVLVFWRPEPAFYDLYAALFYPMLLCSAVGGFWGLLSLGLNLRRVGLALLLAALPYIWIGIALLLTHA